MTELILPLEDDRNESWLMHDLSRHMRRVVDRHAQDVGLTRAQWTALSMIRRNEGIRQTDLADLLEIEPMTLARLLDRLQAAGWIERRADAADRRAKRIYLTGNVQATIEAFRKIVGQLRHKALRGFTAEEQQQFVDYLTRMKTNVVQLHEPQVRP